VYFESQKDGDVEKGRGKGAVFVLKGLDIKNCEIDVLCQASEIMVALS
jgi:hypothetical protein